MAKRRTTRRVVSSSAKTCAGISCIPHWLAWLTFLVGLWFLAADLLQVEPGFSAVTAIFILVGFALLHHSSCCNA
jgi:hypothetical protein